MHHMRDLVAAKTFLTLRSLSGPAHRAASDSSPTSLPPSLPCPAKQKRLEALRKDMPSDVDVSIDPAVSMTRCMHGLLCCIAWLKGVVGWAAQRCGAHRPSGEHTLHVLRCIVWPPVEWCSKQCRVPLMSACSCPWSVPRILCSRAAGAG